MTGSVGATIGIPELVPQPDEPSQGRSQVTETSLVVRVLVVDAYPVVREGLQSLLEILPGFEVVATASDSGDALRLLTRVRPDVVLLDTGLPHDDLVETTRRIKGQQPGAAVLLFDTDANSDVLRKAMTHGASGVILKTIPVPELLRAITEVVTGRSVIDPDLVGYLSTPRPHLSEREQQVLTLLGQGMKNKEISLALSIASGTVKRHVENIGRKLGKSSRAALVAEAFRRGLLG